MRLAAQQLLLTSPDEDKPWPKTTRCRTFAPALSRHPNAKRQTDLRIQIEDNVVILTGTVDDIAAKRLIPRIAIEASGGLGVRDALRLDAHADLPDLAEAVARRISQESLFADYEATTGDSSDDRTIGVTATDGLIELTGRVESLRHRRLAEVFAWWTPGCTDVNNRLYTTPPEQDTDAAIKDAVQLALQRDARLDPGHVAVRARDQVVTLLGTLPDQDQKRMAEHDAWYVAGVHEVDNCIRVLNHEQLDECADEASRESFPASDPPAMTAVTGVGGTDDR